MNEIRKIVGCLFITAITLLAFFIGGSGCDPPVQPPASFVLVEPDTVWFSEIHLQDTVYLATYPAGAWKVSEKPDWIMVAPSSGIFVDQPIELVLSAEIDSLMAFPGRHSGEITISGQDDSMLENVAAFIDIDEHPILEFSKTSLYLDPDSVLSDSVILRNIGTGTLIWSIDGWEIPLVGFIVEPEPKSGAIGEGDSTLVFLYLDWEFAKNYLHEAPGILQVPWIGLHSNSEIAWVQLLLNLKVPVFEQPTASLHQYTLPLVIGDQRIDISIPNSFNISMRANVSYSNESFVCLSYPRTDTSSRFPPEFPQGGNLQYAMLETKRFWIYIEGNRADSAFIFIDFESVDTDIRYTRRDTIAVTIE